MGQISDGLNRTSKYQEYRTTFWAYIANELLHHGFIYRTDQAPGLFTLIYCYGTMIGKHIDSGTFLEKVSDARCYVLDEGIL